MKLKRLDTTQNIDRREEVDDMVYLYGLCLHCIESSEPELKNSLNPPYIPG